MTDTIGDQLYNAYAAVTEFFKGTSDEEKAANKKIVEQSRAAMDSTRANSYNAEQQKLQDEYNAKKKQIEQLVGAERTAANQKRQANRAAKFYLGLTCRDVSVNDLAGAVELLFIAVFMIALPCLLADLA